MAKDEETMKARCRQIVGYREVVVLVSQLNPAVMYSLSEHGQGSRNRCVGCVSPTPGWVRD